MCCAFLSLPLLLVFLIIVDFFSPTGEPISLHLLRCVSYAVVYYSLMNHSLQLQQSRPANNQVLAELFVKAADNFLQN